MIVIALGSNLTSDAGPPEVTIAAALDELERQGVIAVEISPMYATPAWPDPRDPSFVNAVARVETSFDPEKLMRVFEATETMFGRVRGRANAPRTLDIDLLDYDGMVRAQNPALPHPRMETRGFVLVPLADLAPRWRHPVSGKLVGELVAALSAQEQKLRKLPARSTGRSRKVIPT